jgi:S-adenosylmethionine synthetase
MNLVKLSNDVVVNLAHMVKLERSENNGVLYLLGLPQPVAISIEDYFALVQISEYSEAKLLLNISEMTPMTVEKSMKLLTELMLHFVAHAMAAQQGTLATFPLNAVYERIANILNQLNTVENAMAEDELSDEENEEDEK